MSLTVAASAEEAARAAAVRVTAWLRDAVAARGAATLAVPGGRSALALFRALVALERERASEAEAEDADTTTERWEMESPAPPSGPVAPLWGRVGLWFVDERAVGPDDPESNAALALRELAGPLAMPAGAVHRMHGEASDLEAAAREYEAGLPAGFDVVVLGVGEDGHVASLFPGAALLDERRRRVAVVTDSPKPPPRRLTLTPLALAWARAIAVLATGADKAEAVARAQASSGDPRRTPARLARAGEWFVDRAAAARLSG